MTPIGLVLDALTLRDTGRERPTGGDVDGGWQRAMEQAACAEWFKPWQVPDTANAAPPAHQPDVVRDRWHGGLPGASPWPAPTDRTARAEAASARVGSDTGAMHADAASTAISPPADDRALAPPPSINAPPAGEGQANDRPAAPPIESASAVVTPLASVHADTVVPLAMPVHLQTTGAARAALPFGEAPSLATPAPSPSASTPRPGPAAVTAAASLTVRAPSTVPPAANAPVASTLETSSMRPAPVAHGLASTALPPVRVHVERHGDHADVWIGADAEVGHELADVVAGVARTLQRIGLVPRRIVCNGHVVPLPRLEQP